MGSGLKKHKDRSKYMCEPRSFGVPRGQVTKRDPITPDLFMRIGTRVGTITAYYEYVNSSNPLLELPKPQDTPSVTSVVRIPTVRFPPALREEVVPLPIITCTISQRKIDE